MIHKIQTSDNKYYAIVDPTSDFYKVSHSPENIETLSGVIFMILADTKQEVIDLIFDNYEEVDPDEEAKNDKGHINQTPAQIDFSIGYLEAEAQATIDALKSTGFIFLNYIVHPVTGDCAIPFQQKVFDAIPAGPLKDQLEAQAVLINQQGRRKTKAEMQAAGWF